MASMSLKSLFLLIYSSVILFAEVSCASQTRDVFIIRCDFGHRFKLATKEIDDTTAEKFFLLYNAGQKKIKESRKSLDEAINELSKAKGNSKKVNQLIEKILQKHKNSQDATNEMLKSIRNIFTKRQYAEFLIFEESFPEILRKSLQERIDSVRK